MVDGVERAAHHADPADRPRPEPGHDDARIWPVPVTTYLVLVSSASPIGPRACSFWVEMPISAPNPNSPAVGERGRRVDHDRGGVDPVGELVGRARVDAVTMASV